MTIETSEISWDGLSRQIRNSMGIGRDRFARLLQVAPRTVMRWENGENGQTIVPQGVQQMKLLALSLRSGDEEEEQQEILSSLLGQASSLRAKYEAKSTTIKTYDVPLDIAPPPWFDDLLQLKKEKNWRALLLMGPHFLPQRKPGSSNGNGNGHHGNGSSALSPLAESMACLWIGNAAFMEGDPFQAIEYFDKGLDTKVPSKVLRCVLLSNKGYALTRCGKLREAVEALDASLAIDRSHRGALRNKIVAYSHAHDERGAFAAACELLERYPKAGESGSELGQLLVADPDLKFFRETKSFARAFPGLAEQSAVS
jgi:tetratricopeptide (TPR) repeat protein